MTHQEHTLARQANLYKKNTAICWKGIAAVFIMLGHICPTNTPMFIKFFLSGNLWVGLFFFYSGYGLQYSLDRNNNYLSEGFLEHKIKKVYVPFLIAETMFTLVLMLKGEIHLNSMTFLVMCTGIRLSNSVLWYVIEILIVYLLFWCINRMIPKYQWVWIVFFSLFLGIAVLKDLGTYWYISTSCVLLGIFYKEINLMLEKYNQKNLQVMVVIIFALFYCIDKLCSFNLVTIKFLPQNYLITALDMMLAPMFIYVCKIVSDYLEVYNKVFMNIGSISYEIYLYHMLVRRILQNICGDSFVGVLIIAGITILVGELIFLLRRYIRGSVRIVKRT